VDSDALAKALRSEQIFAAALDVVDGEPNVPADHPLVKEPRCVILPHVGSATWDAREAMAMLCRYLAYLQLRLSLIVRL
jgi:glyoxylate/hydroxypyruvate reductase